MTAMNSRIIEKELRNMLMESGLFSGLDIHFACFIARLTKSDSHAAALAAALVSRETAAGNICLKLADFAGKILPDEPGTGNPPRLTCPPGLGVWIDQLMTSGVVGEGMGNTPLVLDSGNRLYLRRYWEYENTIASFIRQRTAAAVPGINYTRLGTDLGQLFRPLPDNRTDWQKVAAIIAVTRSLSVISGGPGTGKTTTVAKILYLLHRQYDGKEKPRIILAAPTGKAASRLQETLIASDFQKKLIVEPAKTLHRLLGPIPDSPYFRHNHENPLSADVIVIDEASMVDLPLMAKLMGAVPESARLILLGDRHQLASVQPGSVLGDICPAEGMHDFSKDFCQQAAEICGTDLSLDTKGALPATAAEGLDSFIELTDNYRFPEESAIAGLSRAVKEGDADRAVDLLTTDQNSQVTWADIPAPEALGTKLRDWEGFAGYEAMRDAKTPDACLSMLDRFRVLCGLRRGPYGMQRINTLIAQQLGAGMDRESYRNYSSADNLPSFIPGQPVMVTRNDYNLGLFNGDVGIIGPGRDSRKALRVYFRMENGGTRDIGFSMLPEHETVYAMTVHKSQGSEFSHVLLILPEQDSPLLTRELLYTAITRAREKLQIWGRKEIFHAAVKRQIKRVSGLTDKIWGEANK